MKKIAFFVLLVLPLTLLGQKASRFFPEKDLMTVGVYYYPEHWDSLQWERDIRNISDMGFEFVHLAEFAWFKLEPVEGKYNFSWLDKVVSLCQKYRLKVLMCTPSATTPAWMRNKYPETFVMFGNYIRQEHGTRGLGSIVNPLYHQYVEKIVKAMAERYGQNPVITGWQLDNEPDAKPDYSPSSQEAFRLWLKKKYKNIDALNMAWGAAFWSQYYSTFDEIIIPNTSIVSWWGNNPQALLDFKRYSADVQAEFLDFQAQILRQYISPQQFITTNYTAVCQGSDASRTKDMDFATFTAYPNGGQANIGDQGFRIGNPQIMSFANDFYRNITGVTGIMELQPGPVNWGNPNPLLLPGTVRMWLFYNFSEGCKLACSYRYRQILYGAEQYHSGIVKTDGVTPSPGGEDYMQFIKDLRLLRNNYTSAQKIPEKLTKRKTAILWNLENYWTIERQKQTLQWDAWGFAGKYDEMLKSFGAPVDVVSENTDLSAYPFVIVPAYEMVDLALISKWRSYAEKGGNLIITCRTATKTRNGHFWEAETAAPLISLIGAHVAATDMLPAEVTGEITYKSKKYAWNNWADLFDPLDGTQILATYSNQFYAGKAAVVKQKLGKGSVTYIGVDTDDAALEKDVLRDLYAEAGVATENYPKGIYVNWNNGFYIAVNFTSENYSVSLPANAQVLIGEKTISPAGVVVWKE